MMVKVVITDNSDVGKTCLIHHYIHETFNGDIQCNIGTAFDVRVF